MKEFVSDEILERLYPYPIRYQHYWIPFFHKNIRNYYIGLKARHPMHSVGTSIALSYMRATDAVIDINPFDHGMSERCYLYRFMKSIPN